MFEIEEELKKLPTKPGVYLMHDEADQIIYVGKAVNLKNRVRQYFRKSTVKSPKIEIMVSLIERFEYIVTDSEMEALVLECNLIKEYNPRYNTMLKDDKSYPYIKVTIQEDFPRVLFSRDMKKDKSRYFGPYASAGAVKDTIDLIHKLYKIRVCRRSLPKEIGKERPCLNYHIKQCDAPCQGYISKEEYGKNVDQALDLLKGNYDPVLERLQRQMTEAADNLEFEEAAGYRELLVSVQKIAQKQKFTDSDLEDRDIIAFAAEGRDAVVQLFFIREGKLIGRDHFHLSVDENDEPAWIMAAFIKQFYSGTPYIPRELYLQCEIDPSEALLISEWLSAKREQKVTIRTPKKGEKARLVELAQENARLILSQDKGKIKREEARTVGAAGALADLLTLPSVSRMEAFDISNTSGFESVGSMVVYENGKPKRSDYRKFKIKSVQGPNDYASMEEVLTRRFSHGLEETRLLKEKGVEETLGSFTKFPDLILMDGGKGQVHIAEKVLEELNLQIPVCGMVKDDNHRTRGLYYQDREVPLIKNSESFRLITRIQDEAHRFAIEYHRSLRSKGQVKSILDDIPGVGPARRKALMREFQSMDNIRNATVEELKALPEMNERSARQVFDFFH